MRDGATKSFQQSYNAQISVDAASQIIVAAAVTQDAIDTRQLVPMLTKIKENLGQLPAIATADNGYFSEEGIVDERLMGVDLYIATGREKKGKPPSDSREVSVPTTTTESAFTNARTGRSDPPGSESPPSIVQQMRSKLATAAGKATYKLRKSVVEPVFGQIKEARCFRRFSFRGLVKVTAEWDFVAWTHNLLKLFRSGWTPKRASEGNDPIDCPVLSGAV